MPDKDFKKFRDAVLVDPKRQGELQNIADRATFKENVVAMAAKLDCNLNIDDVEAAMRTGRRKWIERWI